MGMHMNMAVWYHTGNGCIIIEINISKKMKALIIQVAYWPYSLHTTHNDTILINSENYLSKYLISSI